MATSAKNRNAIIIACCAAIAAIAVCVLLAVLFTSGALSGGASKTSGGSSDVVQIGARTVTVKADNGKEATTIERPAIINASTVGTSAEAAPALVRYIGTSPSSSGNGQSDQTTQTASSSDGSQASSGASGEGASTGDTSNPYGDIATYTVAGGLSNVVNKDAFYLSNEIQGPLQQNLFAVVPGGDLEFFDLYEMNRYNMKANFVTVDSMMHAYHQYFAFLQKNTEKGYLSAKLLAASQALLAASQEQQSQLAGTEWEDAAKRNVAFFAVACSLLDPATQVPADVATEVNADVANINAASGVSTSAITGENEDFTQYIPRGYYEGDAALERYFKAMMWYGRMNFTQSDESLDQSALLMTLAMDDGSGGKANGDWEAIYSVTSFFAGTSDDLGFYEYFPCIEAAYGTTDVATIAADEGGWGTYLDLISKLEAPQVNSMAGKVTAYNQLDEGLDDAKGFRFMGQRFTLDESIFQQLVIPEVPERVMPSALDLPAALGSDTALEILKEEGSAGQTNYIAKLEEVRADMADSDTAVWSESLYSQWLYTLNPLLEEKGEGYPMFMQSDLWDRKDLNTYLGSYAELKHDTVLYTKQMLVEMGGGPIDFDDRGYVECEPELFKRLSSLSQATIDGLAGYGLISEGDKSNMGLLKSLADQLATMAEKELAGTELTSQEYDIIRSYGGQLEHIWEVTNPEAKQSQEAPAAIVVDIATDEGTCLEIGTGRIDTIYVIVPINGELHLCSGGVYSYYEFDWPASDRLTDSKWRSMLGIGAMGGTTGTGTPEPVQWTDGYTVELNNRYY